MQLGRTNHSFSSTSFQPVPVPSARAVPDKPPLHPLARDRVIISDAGRRKQQAANGLTQSPSEVSEDQVTISTAARQQLQAATGKAQTPEAQRIIAELRRRDSQVRAHEQAHLSAAGRYAKGGPSYIYQVGPDGKQYAVGGEVAIDLSAVPDNPRATLQKATAIRRAAQAPANPSGADRAIAARATQMATEAQRELAQEATNEGGRQVQHTHVPGETCEACQQQQNQRLSSTDPGYTITLADHTDQQAKTATVSLYHQTAIASYQHSTRRVSQLLVTI